jgi:hypothetical protein
MGLHWHVVENHFWLELHINHEIFNEYKKEDLSGLFKPNIKPRMAVIDEMGRRKIISGVFDTQEFELSSRPLRSNFN